MRKERPENENSSLRFEESTDADRKPTSELNF